MDWLECRRLRAWELIEAGWRQVEVAEVLGVTKGAVSQWVKRVREGGIAALRRHPTPGAQSKLSPEQVEQLLTFLARGAEAYGFRGNVWSHARIVSVIYKEFGVKYHENHIARILRNAPCRGCGIPSAKKLSIRPRTGVGSGLDSTPSAKNKTVLLFSAAETLWDPESLPQECGPRSRLLSSLVARRFPIATPFRKLAVRAGNGLADTHRKGYRRWVSDHRAVELVRLGPVRFAPSAHAYALISPN